MATDGPIFRNPAEEEKFHKFLSKFDRDRPSFASVIGSALNGAVLGAFVGWAVHHKEHGHREIGKHALAGAALAGGVGLLGYLMGKGGSKFFHFVDAEGHREMTGERMHTAKLLEQFGGMPPGSLQAQDRAAWAQAQQQAQYAASGWWDHLWGREHHDHWGHEHHPWGHEHGHGGWGHERLWGRQHQQHHRPWHEEVFAPPPPPITYGPASAEEQAEAYSHGGLQ
jgi:hypothetical protein